MPKETFYNLPEEKRQRVVQAAEDEFTEYGLDLSSIQRIIKKAGIPRGSFYQYFDDKMDLFIEILRITKERKLSYMAPAIENWRSMDFFDVLQVATDQGLKFADEHPKAVKIAEDILTSKTLDPNKLQEMLLDHSDNHAEPGTFEFYMLLVKHAMEKGELKPDISAEAATLLTGSVMESLGRIAISREIEDPTDKGKKEMERLCSELFSILRDGLAAKDE